MGEAGAEVREPDLNHCAGAERERDDRRDGGGTWVKHPWQMDVSGFHHNVMGGFLSLKFGVYCIGNGEAKLRDFVYRGV